MAIGTVSNSKEAVVPTSLQAPRTWGELQALNSIVPTHFHEARYEALRGENGSAFGSLDSTLASAAWSRRDADNPNEALPANLVKAAEEMLDLMKIRKPEGLLQRGMEGGRHVVHNVASVISLLKKRLLRSGSLQSE